MRNKEEKFDSSHPMPHLSKDLHFLRPGSDYEVPGAIDSMGSASAELPFPVQQVRRGEEESEGVFDLAQASAQCSEEGKSEVFISIGERSREDPSSIRIKGAMMSSSPGSIERSSRSGRIFNFQ
jgi:hypothetical protein